MPAIKAIEQFMEEFSPARLAEAWDNVGLLVGDRKSEVRRLMCCLTVTPATADEAIRTGADMIITHHPLPFAAIKKVTSDTMVGSILLKLIAAGVAVYSPHTAFDSAAEGINQRLAVGLGLAEIAPLKPLSDGLGGGRYGRLDGPRTVGEVGQRLMEFLGLDGLQIVGNLTQKAQIVGVACGAGGEFLEMARMANCDLLVLGEARFHTCLEAEAWGISLVLPGHFASERFAVEALAEVLAPKFPEVQVWASREERDPLRWVGLRLSASEGRA
jgi:dinuclear metal center YbgI/SA1388 family protein